MAEIDNIIGQIEEFPTLPTIYTTLLDVMANPKSSVSDVANIISQDIASSVKILKAVNSPIYHISHEIDTISQAIFYLGFNEVKNLVITMSIMDMFSGAKTDTKFNLIDLWKHSISVGIITRFLGRMSGIKNVENYFLSGVIHDIGKLFFLKSMKAEYSTTINYVHEHDVIIREAEDKTLGINHLQVGGLIADKWKLPETIKRGIKYHDSGRVNDKADLLAGCVHIADYIARTMELGFPGDNLVNKPNEEIWKLLNIDTGAFAQVFPRVMEDYENSVQILLISD